MDYYDDDYFSLPMNTITNSVPPTLISSENQAIYSEQITNNNSDVQRVLTPTLSMLNAIDDQMEEETNEVENVRKQQIKEQLMADLPSNDFDFISETDEISLEELLAFEWTDFSKETTTSMVNHQQVQGSRMEGASTTSEYESQYSIEVESNMSERVINEPVMAPPEIINEPVAAAPPVMTTDDEKRAVLRERNRLAAQRHQQRIRQAAERQIEELEQREQENIRLRETAQRLEQQIETLRRFVSDNEVSYFMDQY